MLTRADMLGFDDISIKEITVPVHIQSWGGKSLYIKQLTRGQQDAYNKRLTGNSRMKQDARAKEQEISGFAIFGHDSWLCVRSICDANGNLLFKPEDADKLDEKNGEAIDWIAIQILQFSGMREDSNLAKELTSEQRLEEEIKN